MNLIAFSDPRNCVNTQYAALSGAMFIHVDVYPLPAELIFNVDNFSTLMYIFICTVFNLYMCIYVSFGNWKANHNRLWESCERLVIDK